MTPSTQRSVSLFEDSQRRLHAHKYTQLRMDRAQVDCNQPFFALNAQNCKRCRIKVGEEREVGRNRVCDQFRSLVADRLAWQVKQSDALQFTSTLIPERVSSCVLVTSPLAALSTWCDPIFYNRYKLAAEISESMPQNVRVANQPFESLIVWFSRVTNALTFIEYCVWMCSV